MTTAGDDPVLDAIIEALVDGPLDHDQIARRTGFKGSQVNSYLYTFQDRFFTPDRDPREGKPIWTLSETVRRARLKRRG